MPPSPKIFISATSSDLGSARQDVKEALLTIGCHPIEQTNFGPDWRTVEEMLRAKITECQALIHIVGIRYGAEPAPSQIRVGAQRRSYTQLEYIIARELQTERGEKNFRVYVFICGEDFPYDRTGYDGQPVTDEPDEIRELQRRHRTFLSSMPHMRERVSDLPELITRIHALREEVLTLEQNAARTRRLTLGVAALIIASLILLATGIAWLMYNARATNFAIEKQSAATITIVNETQALLEQAIEFERKRATKDDKVTWDERMKSALSELAGMRNQQPATLQVIIDAWAAQVKANQNSSTYSRAIAEYKSAHFDSSADLAAAAFNEAKDGDTTLAIKAANLEGDSERAAGHYEAALLAYQKALALVDRNSSKWPEQQRWIALAVRDLAKHGDVEPALKAPAKSVVADKADDRKVYENPPKSPPPANETRAEESSGSKYTGPKMLYGLPYGIIQITDVKIGGSVIEVEKGDDSTSAPTTLELKNYNGALESNSGDRMPTAISEIAHRMESDFRVEHGRIYVIGTGNIPVEARGLLKTIDFGEDHVAILTPDQEATCEFIGIVPTERLKNAVLVDIRSSESWGAFLDSTFNGPHVARFSIPFGPKNWAKQVAATRTDDAPFAESISGLQSKLIPEIRKTMARFPGAITCPRVYLSGGAPWAAATLLHPEKIGIDPGGTKYDFVKIDSHEIHTYFERALRDCDDLLHPNLDAVLKQNWDVAAAEVQHVRSVYTVSEIVAGAQLLEALSEEMHFQNKAAIFYTRRSFTAVRHGFLLGKVRPSVDRPVATH